MIKNIFILILLFFTFNSFGQKLIGEKSTDRIPYYSEYSKMKIINKDSIKVYAKEKPAIFIDGVFLENESILRTVDMKKIENFEIEKESFENNGVAYSGKILIRTKSNYDLKGITLKEFAEKHIKLDTHPFSFQIDENMISGDLDKYIIDENYILKVIIDKIKTSEKDIEITLIKLITRTPENIKRANKIMIKGAENKIKKMIK